MSVAALILAAGRGARAGDGAPKQYRPIRGRSSLQRSLELFGAHEAIHHLRVAIHPGDRALYDAEIRRLEPSLRDRLGPPIEGGAERQDTVRLALEAMATGDAPRDVLIHDAARPFVALSVIDAVIQALTQAEGACVATPVVDTLRRSEDGLLCGELVSRDGLWRAQTPQGFRFAPILAAHQSLANTRATDDAEIARRAGIPTQLVAGDASNVKITRPEDFDFAERWAVSEAAMTPPDIRTGQGFDVHAFGANADGSTDHVMLCGVAVPHDNGFTAHSDGDVGLHALTDAVLGAGALGDIGAHFPPSDPHWRGASSDQFLAHAAALLRAAGGQLANVDVTLICERPKISPHVDAMRRRIGEILGLTAARVSVKATTTEGLGFAGRREGVACMAVATASFTDAAREENG